MHKWKNPPERKEKSDAKSSLSSLLSVWKAPFYRNLPFVQCFLQGNRVLDRVDDTHYLHVYSLTK